MKPLFNFHMLSSELISREASWMAVTSRPLLTHSVFPPCPAGAHSSFTICQACMRASHVIIGFFLETFCLKINFKILMLVKWILVF